MGARRYAGTAQRLPKNVAGKYYTVDDCDGCAYCAAVAPENFEFDKATNTYFIGRQPVGKKEEEVVREAMDDCPVDAVRTNPDEEAPEDSDGHPQKEPHADLLE